jgi:hypothetical protein
MSAPHCCQSNQTAPAANRTTGGIRPTIVRGFFSLAGYVIPGATLALLPKCPVCLAAWLGIATGVGLSVTAVARLRTFLVIVCAAALLFLAARRMRRFVSAGVRIAGRHRVVSADRLGPIHASVSTATPTISSFVKDSNRRV